MAIPKLEFPITGNVDGFKKSMGEMGSLTRNATKQVLNQFAEMNKGLAVAGAASGASWALGWIGKIALVVGAFKLMGDTVGAVRNQLSEMVDVADKATSSGLSPEFWQSFTAGAKGAEKQVALFEGALDTAFQALKPVLNPDWTVWDDGLKKVSAVEEAMRGMRELFTTDQDFSGFELFKNADTQDQRVAAVLTYMKQLQNIGQDVAALDLGDKLFGSRFTDQIRQGTLSIDDLLDNIKTKTPDAFSNEIVKRAKELDNELKSAWNTIDQNLHPSMEGLDSIGLAIKATWVEIVKLMGEASKLLNPNLSGAQGAAAAMAATGEIGVFGFDQGATPEAAPGAPAASAPSSASVPLPRRRPLDAPAPPKDTGSSVDRFETSADSIEKRTAALQAEAAAIDLGTAAREKSKITAQLETVAKQANAAAGLGENVVTKDQRKTIDEVASAYSNAAEQMEKARVASSIRVGKQTAFLTPEDAAIARQLAGIYGNDIPAALASAEAAQLRYNSQLRQMSDLGQDVNRGMLVDFETGIRNGKSAWDSFRDAGVGALGKIADKLASMAADNLWKSAFGGATGGAGGGLGGLLAGLFGGGGPGIGETSALAGASSGMMGGIAFPIFASGGYTGPGAKMEPAGIVHRGEYVFDAASTSRIGVGNLNRMRGYANGGFVGGSPAPQADTNSGQQRIKVDVGVSVDKNGNLQAYVKNVSQDSSRQALSAFVTGPQFPQHVKAATNKAADWMLR